MRGLFASVGLIGLTSLTFAEPGREQPPAIRVPDEHVWTDEVRARFMSVYELKPGQALKLIPTPFIPERMEFYWHLRPHQAQSLPEGFNVMALCRIGDERPQFWWGGGTEDGLNVFEAATSFLGIRHDQLAGPVDVLKRRLPGDWVLDEDSTSQQRLDAIASILSARDAVQYEFLPSQLRRPTIVISGESERLRSDERVQIMLPSNDLTWYLNSGGTLKIFAQILSRATRWPVSLETNEKLAARYFNFDTDEPVEKIEDPTARTNQESVQQLIDSINDQLGLNCRIEERESTVWTLTPRP